jgi:hypothetical protein
MLAPWRRWTGDTGESIRLIAGLRNNTGFFKRMTSPSVNTDARELPLAKFSMILPAHKRFMKMRRRGINHSRLFSRELSMIRGSQRIMKMRPRGINSLRVFSGEFPMIPGSQRIMKMRLRGINSLRLIFGGVSHDPRLTTDHENAPTRNQQLTAYFRMSFP